MQLQLGIAGLIPRGLSGACDNDDDGGGGGGGLHVACSCRIEEEE